MEGYRRPGTGGRSKVACRCAAVALLHPCELRRSVAACGSQSQGEERDERMGYSLFGWVHTKKHYIGLCSFLISFLYDVAPMETDRWFLGWDCP